MLFSTLDFWNYHCCGRKSRYNQSQNQFCFLRICPIWRCSGNQSLFETVIFPANAPMNLPQSRYSENPTFSMPINPNFMSLLFYLFNNSNASSAINRYTLALAHTALQFINSSGFKPFSLFGIATFVLSKGFMKLIMSMGK